MREELDKKLCEDFPIITRERGLSMQQSCMHWGFECGEGWYSIIEDACRKLEVIAQRLKNDGMSEDDLPALAQVKEKFAGLRMYLHYGDVSEEVFSQLNEITTEAETRSCHICEVCGTVGEYRGDLGWVMTLCNEHYQSRKQEVADRWARYTVEKAD